MIVKNSRELVSHGNIQARRICLDLIEHALKAVDVEVATKNLLKVRGHYLVSSAGKIDLSKVDKIHVIGGGKAAYGITTALEQILGARISDGMISVKKGESRRLRRIQVIEAGHPVPDQQSLAAGREITKLVEAVSQDDLVFCAITGGASSLISLPPDGVPFKDKAKLNDLLIKSGAPVKEINCVRNHVSKIKGGLLAKQILPARIVNLIAIDEIEGLPWGPTAPDDTTFADSISVLKKRRLWNKVPRSIRSYLQRGLNDPSLETAKQNELRTSKIWNLIVADNKAMINAASKRAAQLGMNSLVLTSKIEGESSEAGRVLGSIAREIEESGQPRKPPCVIIAGGETTVKIEKARGLGGPSQEFVLGASLKIAETKNIAVASIDTDGTDGPTDIAGGIVDGSSVKRSMIQNLDVFDSLESHSSYQLLRALGDGIEVGPTNTNVMDLDIAVVLENKIKMKI